jgi:hypothetical protein
MKQSAQQSTAIKSILLRSLLGISFAAVLALAPAPAFAQHGGGGGGGGSHGGGGGGGSHGSSGGGHSSGSSGSHPSTNATSSGSTANNAGHWWNPFHGSGTAGKAGGTGTGTSAANANAGTHFAAGNNSWQDPPMNTHTNPQSHFYASSSHDAAISTGRTPPRVMNNGRFASASISREGFRRRPIIFFPFSPFGFGFGFGSPFGFGFGFGCDPLWNWNCPLGYGFGYGAGFGYAGGYGYYGGATGMGYGNGYSGDGSDMNFQVNGTEPSAGGEDMASPEGNSGEWQSAPDSSSQGSVAAPQPYVVVFLRDGSSYAVSDYWLAGGKLHYVTSYGGENSVDANQLDLQRTVNENAAHGVTFTLRPAPETDAPGVPQSLQPAPSNDSQTPAPKPQ